MSLFGMLTLSVCADLLCLWHELMQDVGDWHPWVDRHHPELRCSESYEDELGNPLK